MARYSRLDAALCGAHTGAPALLAPLRSPGAVAIERGGVRFVPPETRRVVRARRSLRNALRRLLRARGHRVARAARALGTSPAALRAAAAAAGLALRRAPAGGPRGA